MTNKNIKIIEETIKDSKYSFKQFEKYIQTIAKRVSTKKKNGKEAHYINCLVREKDVQLKPEEIVRQLYIAKLIKEYHYPKERLRCEHPIKFGSGTKRADLVVIGKSKGRDTFYMIAEFKKPKLLGGKDQLRSYCHATSAPIAIWTNGEQTSYYHRKDPDDFEEISHFEEISDIPKESERLKDILKGRFTLKDLIINDKIAKERKTLKSIIEEMENEVLANAGVDVFEEVFKLIFTKLYDEMESSDDKQRIEDYLDDKPIDTHKEVIKSLTNIDDRKFRVMEFRNTGETDAEYAELKRKIKNLFNEAKEKWPGVFPKDSIFKLSASHLAICISSLQDIKLFNSNLSVVDEAFEYLVNESAKGKKGQYFTPRHVIDMCVKMLNPKRDEYMIDTAAGSCGFPVHTIFKLWEHSFTNGRSSKKNKEIALRVFGIDFDEKAVRVARTLNLIAGDGQTNVLELNTLDYKNWEDSTEKDKEWIRTYGDGFERLEKLRAEKEQNKKFNFDILMANPPFAGDIKQSRILNQYELGKKPNGKPQNKVGRDILFIERNLDFLKPGGRMAIVLPQGRFNNTSDKYIREFIAERARILAVVSLHGNTFQPHTGTKTSVLFLQKWDDELCPREDDYPIFFAVSEKGGKDNSGDYIHLKNEDGLGELDKNGHLIIDHDLDDIAKTFISWAKDEEFSFWRDE